MADELILIPKVKYEHLVKKSEELHQEGGAKEKSVSESTLKQNANDRVTSDSIKEKQSSEISSKDNQLHQGNREGHKASKRKSERSLEEHPIKQKTSREAPTFYVERPVMDLLRESQPITHHRKKRTWINYLV